MEQQVEQHVIKSESSNVDITLIVNNHEHTLRIDPRATLLNTINRAAFAKEEQPDIGIDTSPLFTEFTVISKFGNAIYDRLNA